MLPTSKWSQHTLA